MLFNNSFNFRVRMPCVASWLNKKAQETDIERVQKRYLKLIWPLGWNDYLTDTKF